MNRALRAAALGVLLLSPVALSACSAGQVAQTATQVRDKVGGTATVGDLTIRDAQLAYPTSAEYAAGSDARLQVAISNTGQADDTLTGITGEGFESAELVSGTATPPPAGATPPPTGGATPPPAGTTTPPAAGTTTPPAAGTTTPPAGGSTGLAVPIPGNSNVFVGGDDGPAIVLTGLTEALTVGEGLDVTMSFEQAGDVDVRLLVGVPARDLPRGEEFDFHHEEEGGEA